VQPAPDILLAAARRTAPATAGELGQEWIFFLMAIRLVWYQSRRSAFLQGKDCRRRLFGRCGRCGRTRLDRQWERKTGENPSDDVSRDARNERDASSLLLCHLSNSGQNRGRSRPESGAAADRQWG